MDDNQFAREMFVAVLGKHYECVAVDSAESALAAWTEAGHDWFAAVLSDYNMPGRSGLELLSELSTLDPTVAGVLVTSDGEKEIVARALRLGAHGYFEKGGDLEHLLETVESAVAATAHKRAQRDQAKATREVGRSQLKLLGLNVEALKERVELFFQPRHEASGDFVSLLPRPDGTLVIVASDVSGHDLNAAYTSVYCQGIARGMIDREACVSEVFAAVNDFLLEGWNKGTTVETSIAALGATLDPLEGTMRMLNCGFPQPVLTGRDGRSIPLNEATSSPLGWFPDLPEPVVTPLIGGRLMFWSDGLEDLADSLGADPRACAYRLLSAGDQCHDLLSLARDDIIVVAVDLTSTASTRAARSVPLLHERYPGDAAGQIDAIQHRLENSLHVALPELPEEVFDAVVLCAREGLLNALHHGCGGRAEEQASIDFFYTPAHDRLTLEISDTGPGHDFDLTRHEQDSGDFLLEEHRGLILMKNMAEEISFSSGGRVVTMTFGCRPVTFQI